MTGLTQHITDPTRATEAYVIHHLWPDLTGVNQTNMLYLARLDKRGRGRVRATYQQIADARNRSRKTIQHQIQGLITGRFLAREGLTFVIIGAAEHNVLRCGHGACILNAAQIRQVQHQLAQADELAALRRKKDRERKRLARSGHAPAADGPPLAAGGPMPPPF